MVALVFPALPTVTLPVTGRAERFPVRRIFCVGRNYADHAREMGVDEREAPFFFTKPADAVVESGSRISYPPATRSLHHEGELVVAIGKGGKMVSEGDAEKLIWGHAAGNDLTRRDLQQADAKDRRRAGDMAKGFDKSAVVGAIKPGPLAGARLRCSVNGAVRQEASTSDMIWTPASIIAALSQMVSLSPGDLIFTGTPAGVGPLNRGDSCKVEIEGLQSASVTIA
jgi:fumarylpyruvate hydrolase